MKQIIRIGSRASRLAVLQSELVMEQIRRILPDAELELVTMKTTGDKILNRALDQIGGKGLFLKELDAALLAGAVDLCVHSLKDVPAEENPLLPIGAYSGQEAPADVLVLPKDRPAGSGAACGMCQARRAMQFRNCSRMRSKAGAWQCSDTAGKTGSWRIWALLLAERSSGWDWQSGSSIAFHRMKWCRRPDRASWRSVPCREYAGCCGS
ncbi:hypothetical protein [Ruminococcus sp.]|uniref:hypothetical protein n=1 Tax=Ruminococcus sp. TaxID=41978 RepID=UPI0039949A12